jgi:zinc protease
MTFRPLAFTLLAPLVLIGCKGVDAPRSDAPALTLETEKFTLENGLDVVFHVDRSDPVVAINLAAHVGSARETEGRTGFAHLFEHLLFLDSENLGYGGLDEMNTRIGGEGTNGFTTNDMTQYFQAVPKDALEKVIWAEADKLGWFIETVNQDVIDNEKQVVKNEKRQRVDNAPYGHNWYVIGKALYPTDHPYNWQVIGSLEDLDAATLQDAKDFYARWYVPNNVTLTITGDFDVAEAKRFVDKYFGEIPRGPEVENYAPRPGVLTETIKLYHEDTFATLPRLTYVWPTVEQYHPDSYALEYLATYLTEGKTAPFNEVLVDETKVSPGAGAFSSVSEIAGEFYLIAPSNAGTDLDDLAPAVETAFARFEANGIAPRDLDRIKAKAEAEFYSGVQSALEKAIALGEYNLFTDDPQFYQTDLQGYRNVTPDDLMRVYETYLKDRPFIATSFVPKDAPELALEGSTKADVVEEKVVAGEGAAVEFDPAARVIANPTASSFDRMVEPPFGPGYDLPAPDVWQATWDNGLSVVGIQSDEVPLVNFSLRLDAGRLHGNPGAPAVPGLTADMLEKGTANRTTAELEDAIGQLGSTISISAGNTGVFISGTTLSRNFDATMDIVKEMVFSPRWDEDEFETLKNQVEQSITNAEGDPNAIARRELAKLRYPNSSPLSRSGGTGYGSKEALEGVTLENLKAFHAARYTLNGSSLRIVGDYEADAVQGAWNLGDLGPYLEISPKSSTLNDVGTSIIYFYNVPDAKQSVLRLSRPALSATDPDYPLAEAINFPLGGIYTSILNTTLRVEKGYTYGIRSGFAGDKDNGTFAVSSSVRSNVTKESLELIRDILASYGPEFSEADLATMKDALLRGQALKTETLSDKLGLVGEIDAYDYAPDFRAQNAKAIAAMTLDDVKRIAAEHIRPDVMQYLVVGDAATQGEAVEALGLPVEMIK